MAVKLSDYVMQFIAGQGVRHVFMVPGGGAMHLNDSLGKLKDLEFVCNLHEQASAIAAEAYARVTNNLGVALVTTGPGGTNALTGLVGAWLDSTPCLFISGQVKRSDLMTGRGVRQLGVQEVDILSIVRSVTKYAVLIIDPESIRYHLEKGAFLARHGRPGPVWIDIPLDVQAAMIEPGALKGFEPVDEPEDTDAELLQENVKRTVELLRKSERPVILAGNGVRLAGAESSFLAMIGQLKIPVLTTRLGVDLIPSAHPLCFGMPGSIASRSANFILQNADLLLILGARLDMALIAYAPERLARAASKIMVNIDGAEIEKVRSIIDLPICSDANRFITELARQARDTIQPDRSGWFERCASWKRKYPFVLPSHRAETGAVSTYAFSEMLSEELPDDCIVLPGNAGNASELFLTAFSVKAGQRVFHNKGTGAMGFSQPAAIGACLAGGRKLTACVDGDGGFQLNIQELEVVRRLALPIKFFVMNNNGYASIRASQRNYFGRLTAADETSGLTLPRLSKIAEAYELSFVRIEDQQGMREQIRRVLDQGGPVICDVNTIPDEPRAPRVSSAQKADGSMVSKPLEDMWPFLGREEFLANMIVPPLDDSRDE
ncbi:MAG TPA: thiamine pyrophosphate-binding protein [Anaerolineales bacterium]|nr:thiamine pyrophosphate-binding protein [Anaerolineales bacterium]